MKYEIIIFVVSCEIICSIVESIDQEILSTVKKSNSESKDSTRCVQIRGKVEKWTLE